MYSREHHFLTLTWTANWKRRLLFYFISVSYHISCIQIDWSNSSMRSQCGTKMEHQTATIWRCDPSGRWNEALGRVSCASPVPVTFVKPSGSTNRSLTCDPVRMWQHWKKSILFTLMEQKQLWTSIFHAQAPFSLTEIRPKTLCIMWILGFKVNSWS